MTTEIQSATADRLSRYDRARELRQRPVAPPERTRPRTEERPRAPGDTFQTQAAPRAEQRLAQVTENPGRVVDRGPLAAQRALINAGQRAPRGGNDDVTFVGMNPTGQGEAAEFARRSGTRTTFIGNAREQDRVEEGGRTYDLRDRAGIDAYTRTFGLGEDQRRRVADAIETAGPGARDEAARLARHWSTAERGGTIPSRMVISGHSVGNGVWGDGNGTLSVDTMRNLARAMPKAAGQVEDLHIAGCYSGGRNGLDKWREVFPNAKTVWAYSGSAPGAASGAQAHLSRWERATRGRADDLDPAVARSTRKGENVETWSERGGYRTKSAAALGELRRQYDASRPEAERFWSGEQTVTDPQTGPLRQHYNTIQSMLQNRELPAEERPALEAERDRTIRSLYYGKTVAPAFARTHGDAIREGYRALGGPEAPDFGTMSRRDALAAIRDLESRAGANPPVATRRALELLRGLRDLTPGAIPEAWIG